MLSLIKAFLTGPKINALPFSSPLRRQASGQLPITAAIRKPAAPGVLHPLGKNGSLNSLSVGLLWVLQDS
jgi:hypothetical protein